ncbi:MAG: hypothetical protein DWQ36_09160 [Acidobacteria bacterium]|nr:MAG: hypothetical protein DWQ30_22405 [Acidobacteriota bacterium]REK08528.1 MAG: hypothetical protein DWQ36_09160 [Acidobacteriota bacterium]
MIGTFSALLIALNLAASNQTADPLGPEDLLGPWSGTITHGEQTTAFALEIVARDDGKVSLLMTIPAIHVQGSSLGAVPLVVGEAQGSRVDVGLGPFRFVHDAAEGTLSGVMPKGLVPVYELPVTLRRGGLPESPERAELAGREVQPLWSFDAGSPQWAGPVFADGLVYSGGEDGRLHALDAASGQRRWSFLAAGAIRSRATISKGVLYLAADDGMLYALDASSGAERWRVKVSGSPAVRLPFDDPKSRYDRFGSDVTVADRLYLGTHDGRLLALDPEDGAKAWEHAAGDSILAAPAVHRGRVFFGSYDGHVYALEASTGKLLWKHDTRGPVVSTPAIHGDLVLVGSRSYDFLALDAATGEPAWSHYVWFSWIESSASVRDAVAYVGSSDAAAVFALQAATGRALWSADVRGWTWGQPAVTEQRVYAGAASTPGYLVGHHGGVFALDRKTGQIVWYFQAPASDSGPFGFPGSPATGDGRVYASSLDGRVLAFAE